MKVNFERRAFDNGRFTGAAVSPDYEKSYFNLNADSVATLDFEMTAQGAQLKFWMTDRSLWDWYSGLDMAELTIPLSTDLRDSPVSGDCLALADDLNFRDVIFGGMLVVKTPSGVLEFYLGEKSRGTEYGGEYLRFSEAGEYRVSLIFITRYRYNAGGKLGEEQFQYHVWSYAFAVEGEGENPAEAIVPEVDEVFRFDPRTVRAEIQKRSDDFYWWKDCVIESVIYKFTSGAGQKFFDVTYTYGGNRRTESVREDFAPNFTVSGV